MNPLGHIRFAAASDVGRKRANNEDAYGSFPELGVWVVADGMGGGDDGEVASAAVVRAVGDYAGAHPLPADGSLAADDVARGLVAALDAASAWILARTKERRLRRSCGSTVAGVVLDRARPRRAIAFHAGDSRVYRVRPGFLFGEIEQITRDHSAAETLGVKDRRRLNPMWANVITRAVGLRERVGVELTEFDVRPGDRLLLCTDGLSGMVPDRRMLALARKGGDLDRAVERLVAEANAAGGADNITVSLVEISKGA